MKKLILSFALICFVGAAKIHAQSSDASAPAPATSVTAVGQADPETITQSGNQTVQTPATVKTTVKSENKKGCCSSHSSKPSCCMSKDGASKKECKDKHSEKAEAKPEDSEIKNN